MGMEKTISFFRHEKNKNIPVPPGFVSLTSFTLKRVEDSEESSTPSEAKTNGTRRTSSSFDDVSTIEMDIKNRPWILHSPPCSKFEAPCLEPEVSMPLKASLPKGVTRGCSSCPNCVKVTSGWCPQESRRPILEDAPTFYPTEEEFKDSLQYVSSIRPKAERFGICRIVPPPSWIPPCIFRTKNVWKVSKFKTQIQQVDDLANLNSYRTLDSIPGDMTLKRKRVSNGSSELGSYDGCSMGASDAPSLDSFKSETGPELTLEAFKMYADDFKSQYFYKKGKDTDSSSLSSLCQEKWEPNVGIGNIEGEFWRIVENPSEEIEVICGANVDTRQFRSGFPVNSDILEKPGHTEYVESGWNLNNVPKLPGSLLQFVCSGICATSVPRVFMGMCLSSHCWKVEEHQLYSLSYLHLGSVKVWYGIPARYCYKFEEVVKKHFPMYSEHPEMIWKLPTELSPSVLKSEGIPVYRCIQHPKQFVITFPGAYHSGLDCGFNVMETVNFAPFDWLPFGHHSVEMYREQSRRTSISYDKLLLGAAMTAVRAKWETSLMKRELVDENLMWSSICGKDGILTKLLKIRVKQEAGKKKFLCSSLQSEKMQNDFDSITKRECWICLCDLHLSAVSCLCSPGKYTCAVHAKHFCSAASDDKRFLLRYEIDELNVLIGALEGDLAAVKTWVGIEKLGLRMSSNAICSNTQITSNDKLPPASGEAATSLDVKPIVSLELKEPRVQRNILQKEKSKENRSVAPTLGDVIVLSDDDS